MTALPLDPYRLILDYQALQDMFNDRIEDLNVSFREIDAAGGMAEGNAQKLLCSSQERWARTFGWETLGKMLKGTGMVLVAVVDDERFAPLKSQMATKKRRDKPRIAGSTAPPWLFRKKKAREMGKRRFSLMSPEELKKHQRKAGKASGRARRLRSRLKQMQGVSANHRKSDDAVQPAGPPTLLAPQRPTALAADQV